MTGLHGSARDWHLERIGSLDDGSGDWPWNSHDWWSAEHPSSNMASSSQANASQEAAKSDPSLAAVIVEARDQSAPRSSVPGAKPGIMPTLLHGACLLIAPRFLTKNCQRLILGRLTTA